MGDPGETYERRFGAPAQRVVRSAQEDEPTRDELAAAGVLASRSPLRLVLILLVLAVGVGGLVWLAAGVHGGSDGRALPSAVDTP